MDLTKEQIDEITGCLDMGLRCFYHLETGEILKAPNFSENEGFEDYMEIWQEELEELDKNAANYFEIEKMSSRERFLIMADFAKTIENKNLQDRLTQALDRPKPFRNFKAQIDNAGPYRQKWFDYERARLIGSVIEQIEQRNQEWEEE